MPLLSHISSSRICWEEGEGEKGKGLQPFTVSSELVVFCKPQRTDFLL